MKNNLLYWKYYKGDKKFTTPLVSSKFLNLIKKDCKILDFGCGYGRVIKYLWNKGYKNITGIDPSPILIERAQENLKNRSINLIVGTINEMPKEKYDVIIICAVSEYFISQVERKKLIKNIYNHLNARGMVYLQTFIQDENYNALYSEAEKEGYEYGTIVLKNENLFLFHDTIRGIDNLFKKFKKIKSEQRSFKTWSGKRVGGYISLYQKIL